MQLATISPRKEDHFQRGVHSNTCLFSRLATHFPEDWLQAVTGEGWHQGAHPLPPAGGMRACPWVLPSCLQRGARDGHGTLLHVGTPGSPGWQQHLGDTTVMPLRAQGCPDGGRCRGTGVPVVLPQTQAAEGSVCAAAVTAVQSLKGSNISSWQLSDRED